MKHYIWQENELEFIRKNALILSDTEIATQLTSMTGRTFGARLVECCRRKLGIYKVQGRNLKLDKEKTHAYK